MKKQIRYLLGFERETIEVALDANSFVSPDVQLTQLPRQTISGIITNESGEPTREAFSRSKTLEMRKKAREKRSHVQKTLEMRKKAREKRSHVQKTLEMRKKAREKRSHVQKTLEMRKKAREKRSHVQKHWKCGKKHERNVLTFNWK